MKCLGVSENFNFKKLPNLFCNIVGNVFVFCEIKQRVKCNVSRNVLFGGKYSSLENLKYFLTVVLNVILFCEILFCQNVLQNVIFDLWGHRSSQDLQCKTKKRLNNRLVGFYVNVFRQRNINV